MPATALLHPSSTSLCRTSSIKAEIASKGVDRIFRGAPEIAIEIVSPADEAIHLKHKIDAYLAAGSRSVWVVFPDARSVMIHTSNSVRELKADQSIEDALLPGFSTPVSTVFELT